MRIFLVLAAVLSLSACETEFGDRVARAQARAVVNDVIEKRFPGVDASPVTDCIIDNATGAEIAEIAAGAVTGVTDRTAWKVIQIAQRPATVQCYIEQAGPIIASRILAAS